MKTLKIPKGWRKMRGREIIQQGDKIEAMLARGKSRWNPCKYTIGNSVSESFGFTFIRKIKK